MPAATEARSIWAGWRTTLSALVMSEVSFAGRAGQCRQLSEEDVGAQSREESQHHRLGHESHITTETHHPRGEDHEAGDQGQPDHGIGTLIVRRGFNGLTRSQRGRARGGDHHHLGAGRQSASHPADHARVETVDRVHPGQCPIGHAVRNRGDRARHPRKQVAFQVPSPRPHLRRPGPHARDQR